VDTVMFLRDYLICWQRCPWLDDVPVGPCDHCGCGCGSAQPQWVIHCPHQITVNHISAVKEVDFL